MRLLITLGLTLLLVACAQPTRQELLEAERERQRECEEMQREIASIQGQPLRKASLQENYNRSCLGQEYPDQVQ